MTYRVLFSEDQSEPRRVDEALVILPLFDGSDFPFDVVRARLAGDHPALINHASDRAYYFLRGHAEVRVGDRTYDASPGDLVSVPRGEVHSLTGDAEFLNITSPPFNPDDEEVLEG